MEPAKKAKGGAKEVLGALTGDRRVEAEGRVEQQVVDPGSPQSDESDAAVEQQERAVREDHHDVPGAPPEEDGPLGTT